MSSPPVQFFMEGPCDQAYLNTRDHPRGVEHKRFVEHLWSRFHQFADTHFRQDARNQFHQRFWEMYLAVALLEHDFNLQRHGDEGPEFYAPVANSRVWFEAIAPGPGLGPDQVPQLVFGEFTKVSTERILLRFTNSLAEKRQRYAAAQAKGIVSPEDQYVLAINSRAIRHAPDSNSMPHFIQAFLAVGPLAITIDVKTGEVTDTAYQYRPSVSKASGSNVSTRSFLDQEASFCSAVLHSGVDCANHPDQLGGDFSILHNPNAERPLDAAVFQWCEQFTLRGEALHRSKPSSSLQGTGGSRCSPPAAERDC